ncbi:metal ABC transporter permease [Fructobacillus sp. M1-13]|uniref:High-affinity zinc uptake system membrane protein ZnuB n=1 Tax=Fructobacillus papyriferae TaxID=2713171 RepID=A0ABS5QPC0_9LACO|nr:metal ABC transporter permease [Fructobacillus papyriferae]MBS9334935.1 metal ABC transporter permease [Fructobacillus papyriferae]MCD2159581.1 metal ABC transporter permease [Fructobacillus papyriferae]
MFSEAYMVNAFVAGTVIAVISALVGTFVVARSYNFLTHSLSEIAFAGAALGFWLGFAPLLGMVFLTATSALAIGSLENAKVKSDNVTSAISALAIGLGILFLALGHSAASSATGILFGSVLGISTSDLFLLFLMAFVVILLIFWLFRPLSLLAFDEAGLLQSERKKGLLRVAFLLIMALSVAISSQLVGSLLVFVLVTLPAASARMYQKSIAGLIGLAIFFALFGTWAGLTLAYLTNLPTSVFIALIEVALYLLSLSLAKVD